MRKWLSFTLAVCLIIIGLLVVTPKGQDVVAYAGAKTTDQDIIGSWVAIPGSGYVRMLQFYSDGTFLVVEDDQYVQRLDYVYDGSQNTLDLFVGDRPLEPFKCFICGNGMILCQEDGEELVLFASLTRA